MRKTLALAAMLLAIAFAIVPASAQSAPPCCLINIDDLNVGPPVVTFTGGISPPLQTDNEFALIGLGNTTFSDAAVLFTESPSDPTGPPISDALALFTDPNGAGQFLIFASDGSSQLDAVLGIIGGFPSSSVAVIAETGDWQDVSLDLGLGTTGLVAVRSGEENVTTAPEPSSLMLLGSGMLGFAGVFRRKRIA